MSAGYNLLIDRVRAATEDEYTIEGELGRGGMAAVFLARDIALDRRVAIKVMLPDLAGVAGFLDRFVIEARTAAHLDHPGIVTVYAVKQRAGLTFIVMKYIEGRTLDQVLAIRGALDPIASATIGARVAEALHFAHAAGVIHRDVKPSNIIIDQHGRPVVTDFGIAKVGSSPSLTAVGSTLGTPTYMSPEQCRGLPATPAADQYSLGVMLYELLTGSAPFHGTLFELLSAHAADAPRPIRETTPGVDPAVEAVVMRMLEKDPAARFASLGEVAKTLSARSPRRSHAAEMKAIIDAISPSADAITEELPIAEVKPPGEFTRAFGASLAGVGTTAPRTPQSELVAPPPPPPTSVAPTPPPPAPLVPIEPTPSPISPDTVVIEAPRVEAEASAGVPAFALPSEPKSRRGLLIAAVAVVALGAIGYVLMTGDSAPPTASNQTPAPVQADTAPTPAPVQAAITPPATDSTQAKVDSVVAPKPDSTPKPVVVAAPPPVQKKSEPSTKTQPKSTQPAAVRGDSTPARCAAIQLKLSVGEELMRADSVFMRRECAQRP
jgi:serine/threonine-protein kinase